MAALEYADSLGVDLVSTSLGYTVFDDSTMNHRLEELDGYTVPASRAASLAAFKGMVLFIAVGNEGNSSWQKACVPSDAQNILAVGAVGRDSLWASFSSYGTVADGRIKPDVMSLGQGTCLFYATGFTTSRGTSYATPILAGMAACLWEALPWLTSLELMQLIKENSDRYAQPDAYYGYGLPNIAQSYDRVLNGSSLATMKRDRPIYLDSGNNRLCFSAGTTDRWLIYSFTGAKLLERELDTPVLDVSYLPAGMYIALVFSEGKHYVCKFSIHKS